MYCNNLFTGEPIRYPGRHDELKMVGKSTEGYEDKKNWQNCFMQGATIHC
jgi:hypothetical protein